MVNPKIATALKYNIPYQLFFEDEIAKCKWLFVGEGDFVAPFFNETILLESYKPVNIHPQKCISEIAVLPEWAQHIDCCAPDAIIFHVSRCGSTLITQLLGKDSENIVLSEVPFFDELLQWKAMATPESETETLSLLKAAITFYTAKRTPVQKRSIIKTDSWHIFFYPLFRKLFPATPFILLYRSPDEVIKSHQNRRGMQMVPNLLRPQMFGFTTEEVLNLPFDEYTANVLEKYFEHFIQISKTDPLAFPINYSVGGMAIVEKIAKIAGFTIAADSKEKMKRRSGYHAKYPELEFTQEALLEQHPDYMQKVFELYEVLTRR